MQDESRFLLSEQSRARLALRPDLRAIWAAGPVIGWDWSVRSSNAGGYFIGIMLLPLSFFVAMAGAGLGVAVSRSLTAEHPLPRPPKLKTWHIGAAVAIAELAFVGALALARV